MGDFRWNPIFRSQQERRDIVDMLRLFKTDLCLPDEISLNDSKKKFQEGEIFLHYVGATSVSWLSHVYNCYFLNSVFVHIILFIHTKSFFNSFSPVNIMSLLLIV